MFDKRRLIALVFIVFIIAMVLLVFLTNISSKDKIDKNEVSPVDIELDVNDEQIDKTVVPTQKEINLFAVTSGDPLEVGTLKLVEYEKEIRAIVNLDSKNNQYDDAQIYIYAGDCNSLGSEFYELSVVSNNLSNTLIPTSFFKLQPISPLSLRIYSDNTDTKKLLVCGDIKLD